HDGRRSPIGKVPARAPRAVPGAPGDRLRGHHRDRGQVVRGGHRGGRPAPVRGRSTLMLPGSIVGPKSQGGEVAEVLATVEEDREPAGVPARVVRIQVRSVDSLIAYSLIAAVGLWRAWAVVQWTFRQDDWVWAT